MTKTVPQSERIHAYEISSWFDLFVGVHKTGLSKTGRAVLYRYAVIWDDGTDAARVVKTFWTEEGAHRFYHVMVKFLTQVGLPLVERNNPAEIADCVQAAASHARKVRWHALHK